MTKLAATILIALAATVAASTSRAQSAPFAPPPPPAPMQAAPPGPSGPWSPAVGAVPVPPGTPPGAVPMPPGFLEAPGLWPRTLPHDEGVPPPPGYHVGREPLRAVWIAGLVVLASTYGISVITGAAVASEEGAASGLLAIPVAGPAAYALVVEDGREGRPLLGALSLVSLAQATGVAMLIAGLVAERDVYHRNDVVVSERQPTTRVAVGPAGFALIREF